MTRTLLRAGALSCALLASTALTTPAHSQAQTVAPAFKYVDTNGVDLVTGRFEFELNEGTIGSGQGALSLVRRGFGIEALTDWENIWLHQTGTGTTTRAHVTFGDRTESFTKTGSGSYVADQGNGATLTRNPGSNFVYTGADGTVATFGAPVPFGRSGDSNFCTHVGADQHNCAALPLTMVRPRAGQITFNWNVRNRCTPDVILGPDCEYYWRLSGVSNSFGYAAAFTYANNSAGFTAPPPDWYRKTGATLSNTRVSGSTPLSVTYTPLTSTSYQITDAGGRVWRFSHNVTVGIRRPGSSTDDITATFAAGVVSSVTRDGVTTNYARSVSGSTATMVATNALSQSRTIVSDLTIGRPTSVTDELGRTISYQYDANGRLTRTTLPEGNYAQLTYDTRGNVTERRQVAKPSSGLADIVTSASFPATCANPVTCNLPTSTTDARGNVTDYTYDSVHGGMLTMTLPAATAGANRPQTRYSYTQITAVSGQPVTVPTGSSSCQTGIAPGCVGTSDEARSTISYDTVNIRPIGVTNADGTGALSAPNAMTYDSNGNLLTVDGPLAGAADTTRYRYNGSREIVGIVGPDPDGAGGLKHRAVRTSYDGAGRVMSVERGTVNSQSDADWGSFAPAEHVQQDYDANHRLSAQRLVSGGTTYALTQTSYNALGRLQCAAQRMNPAEFASLPADACTLDTQGSFGSDRITRTSYDAAGQVNLIQAGYGVSGVQADEVATTYRSNGQVETLTDAEGNRTTYVYDGHDRLSQTQMPSPTTDGVSNAADYEQLTYETTAGGTRTSGTVASRRLRDGTSIAFGYDNLARLTSKNLPGSEPDVTYAYDLLGRMTQAARPSQPVGNINFTYDALGRQLTESSWVGTATSQYDLAGRRTRLTWPGSGLYVDHDYLVTGETSAIRENGATSGAGVLASFTYDNLGRRTLLTRGNGTSTSYGYDAASRLAALTNDLAGAGSDLALTFGYNPAGQLLTRAGAHGAYAFGFANQNVTDAHNGLNQIVTTGATSVGHDARGNITTIGTAGYTYTSENRMQAGPGGAMLAYDPLGRLYFAGISAPWTYLGYDGDRQIAEYDSLGGVLRRYVHGPGTDEPLVWYEGAGTSDRRWFHADERGSIVATSNGAGNAIQYSAYDEYGVPSNPAIGRFGYTGQAWIPEVGLSYYRARMYNPALGRFMQTDPSGFSGGINLYAYVRGDPINSVDPTGLQEDEILILGRPCNGIWIGLRCIESDTAMGQIGVHQVSSNSWPTEGRFWSGASGTGEPPLPPPPSKRLSQCMQSFLSRHSDRSDWGQIMIVSDNPLPGMAATVYGDNNGMNITVRPDLYGGIEYNTQLLFHELAHPYQWQSGQLTTMGYVGSSLLAIGEYIRDWGGTSVHDRIAVEQRADTFRDALETRYNAEGRPCE